jgi:hypothetical protein
MREGSLAILTGSFVVIGSDPEESEPRDCLCPMDELRAIVLEIQRCGFMPTQSARLKSLIYNVIRRCFRVFLLTAACGSSAFAEEDPYLSTLSQEAQKVEAKTQPTLNTEDSRVEPADDGLNIAAFEEDLKARYKGSYTFYQKLPRRAREEVFLEYRDGASIDEIREKIMDRFLHR